MKKKKASKKGNKKNGVLGDLETQVLVPEFQSSYVTIHLKLVNWVFLDFTLKDVCINNTKLYSIKRKIKERHGRCCFKIENGDYQTKGIQISNGLNNKRASNIEYIYIYIYTFAVNATSSSFLPLPPSISP